MKNRTFLSLLILISIFTLFTSLAKSENVCQDSEGNYYMCDDINARLWKVYTSPFDSIIPNYQIISIANKITIDKGDEFTLSYQISGQGKVVSNKLIAYFPKELLEEDPKYYIYIGEAEDENGTHYCVWYDKYPDIRVGSKEGSMISLVNATFKHDANNSAMIFGENAINGHRPINIQAKTEKGIPSGDYEIKIQFFYSDGLNWYSSQDAITIHVRSDAEKYDLIIGIGIPLVTTGLGAFLGFFTAFYLSDKWEKWKQKRNTNQSILPDTNKITDNKPSTTKTAVKNIPRKSK